ncbi:MAG: class I tRNA ligase family protein [Pseudomonadota bacterium]
MYDFRHAEDKWQRFWAENKSYKATRSGKPKFYVLDMFPYPSGKGLHVGHLKGYVASDVVARYKRACGFEVLHPMGWDSFGLPTERQAQRENTSPQDVTKRNIAAFREQLEAVALSYDWDREIATSDPKYYRWTQWIFSRLFEKGLAYTEEVTVNWCPAMGTVLANEEVVDGKYVETGDPVERRKMKQWMLRITAYADRLLDDLELVDWPKPIKRMQENWIGRSEGAKIKFQLVNDDRHVEVFSTRPDTIFGATYLVLAPEHELLDEVLQTAGLDLTEYVETARNRSELDRIAGASEEKTGFDTSLKAVHPVTKEEIPIWVSDYVLGGYGTGAVMAVPAHDERDFEFARTFDLPIPTVVVPARLFVLDWASKHIQLLQERSEALSIPFGSVLGTLIKAAEAHDGDKPLTQTALENILKDLKPGKHDSRLAVEALGNAINGAEAPSDEVFKATLARDWFGQQPSEAFTGKGYTVNSSHDTLQLNGMWTDDAIRSTAEWLTDAACGATHTNYKIRDWLFSRQRFWGEPFPIVLDDENEPHLLDDSALPVSLPDMDYTEFSDENMQNADGPVTPLGFADDDWLRPEINGRTFTRETNTMPQWAGSCWYFLRFCDPGNSSDLCNKDEEAYWMPVDLYVGGAEHATLHLLYARFWHKFLYDLGVVTSPEPFKKLFNQGMVHSTSYRDASGKYYYPDEVTKSDNSWSVIATGDPVSAQVEKMSKSKCNGVPPEDVISEYGSDALRLYELFMGPIEDGGLWDGNGLKGTKRFLDRLWTLAQNKRVPTLPLDGDLARHTHLTIQSVTEDIESFNLNTAVSAFMKLLNDAGKESELPDEFFHIFARLLQPFAPHFAEELWQTLGKEGSILNAPWPEHDPSLCEEDEVDVVVQVNGKKRAIIRIAATASQDVAETGARTEVPMLNESGFTARRVIYVPGKILNFVV